MQNIKIKAQLQAQAGTENTGPLKKCSAINQIN